MGSKIGANQWKRDNCGGVSFDHIEGIAGHHMNCVSKKALWNEGCNKKNNWSRFSKKKLVGSSSICLQNNCNNVMQTVKVKKKLKFTVPCFPFADNYQKKTPIFRNMSRKKQRKKRGSAELMKNCCGNCRQQNPRAL